MNPMDWIDDLLGRFNWIDETISLLTFARRGGSRRHKIRRADKGGSHSLDEVQQHLKRYGVDSVAGGYSRDHMEYTVGAAQERWHNWLVRRSGAETVELNTPRSRWADKRRARRGQP